MARSILRTLVDRVQRRPEWLERDGDRHVLVRGFSPLDNLICGALGAGLILLSIIPFLVTLP